MPNNLIVYPETAKTEIITNLGFSGSLVWAKYPDKNDDWTVISKSIYMKWNWDTYRRERVLSGISGSVNDRLAEIGATLLSNGYPVQFPNEEIRDIAINQEWIPEIKRWVLAGKGEFTGWIRLWWRYGEPNYFTRAMMLSGARYDKQTKCVCIPVENYEEVLDFADLHNFGIHSKANALVEEYQAKRKKFLTVSLKVSNEFLPETNKNALSYDYGVSDCLKDFDYLPRFDTCTDLYDYQNLAVGNVSLNRVGGLFIDMGLGKTRCAIELAKIRQQRISKIVYFCPVSLKVTVMQEILKHTDCTEEDICMFDDKTGISSLPIVTWYIVGLESVSGSDRVTLAVNSIIDDNAFVIVDESSFIKGHGALRTNRIITMSERARYRLIMTGTPLTEGYEDLYAQMRFLSSQILGYNSFYSFAANHLEYHPDYPGMVVKAHNTNHLVSKIEPYIFQIKKEDALDLPEKIYETRYCELTTKQKEAYQQAKEEILQLNNDDILESYVIFQLFGALQQIVSGFWNREGKLLQFPENRTGLLLDVISEIPENEPVIIWCKYIYSVNKIHDLLKDESVVYCGETSERDRQSNLDLWRSGKKRFLITTISSGGYGLDLTNSRYAIYYENEFSYAHRIQSEDRIHRIGQERKPVYIDLYATCGIEKRIYQAIVRKENVASKFNEETRKCQDLTSLV